MRVIRHDDSWGEFAPLDLYVLLVITSQREGVCLADCRHLTMHSVRPHHHALCHATRQDGAPIRLRRGT